MTALFLSFVFLAYVVIPGTLFRRLFNLFVPLRRFQWTRTEELTTSVVTTVPPLIVAYLLVHFCYWFGHHPFDLLDSVALKWNDYKDVLSASYSEKFFTENRQAILQALERIGRKQFHFIAWFYLGTALEAVAAGLLTRYYGNLRKWRLLGRGIEKFVLPGLSEWHVMFTPFTFSRTPARVVQVDALMTDGTLYQGEVGDFHIDANGCLTGFLLKKARRFLRAEYKDDRNAGKTVDKEKYWRTIPGDSLYLLADKISNLNLSYLATKPLKELAEDTLKKLKIDASVAIQPPQTRPARMEAGPVEPPEPVTRNFHICPHCLANGRLGYVPRVSLETPPVSRTDGRKYHLFLQFGPSPHTSTAGVVSGVYLVQFRFALDALKIYNEPISVLIHEATQTNLPSKVELVADRLDKILEEGKRPASFYKYASGRLVELKKTKAKPRK